MPDALHASDAIAVIAQRFATMEPEVLAQMLARFRAEIPEYASMDEHTLADVEHVSRVNLSSLVAGFTAGTTFSAATVPTQEGAARRARQGVSLEAFLHACRLWGQVSWQTIRDLSEGDPELQEAALELAGRVMSHVDAVSIAAARGYFDSARSHWSAREVMRSELIDALLSGRGSGSEESVRRKLEALDLRPATDYVVVLVRTPEADDGRPNRVADTLSRMLDETRLRLVPDGASLLVGVRSSDVVALYPAARRPALVELGTQVQALAEALAGLGTKIGIGGWHPGLGGVAPSYNEAREALASALAAGPGARIVRFDDIVVAHVIRSSPGVHDVLRDVVAQLAAYDSRRQGQLLETLTAYLRNNGSLKRTADALYVHNNTIIYRLRRIEELTGRNPADPEDRVVLSLAVRLDELEQTLGDHPKDDPGISP